MKSHRTLRLPASRQSFATEISGTTRRSAAAPLRLTACLPLLLHIALGALLLAASSPRTRAQTPTTNPVINPLSLQWPRFFASSDHEFAVYQPQISKWPGNQLEGRFAIAARPAGTSNETYGVAFFTARTEIDKMSRLVTLEDFKITKTVFPTKKAMQKTFAAMVLAELPTTAKIIPLDHLEAVFAASTDIEKVKMQQVDNTPPNIIYTTQPSLLVTVDGAPILQPLCPGYERVVNTRSVLLWNTNAFFQAYYLYAASNWYTAPSIQGPWTVTLIPPADINTALTAALATKQVDPAYPRQPLAAPPVIYVATTPTELIQSTGAANMLSVPGTDLLYISNTDNAIFYYLDDANYYVLISGRWFKAGSLYGPWGYVAAGKLPADFKKIPPDSMKANVLCSVPGTPQAREAVIASTIPQTASIYRDNATLTLDYVGAPAFTPIPGTGLFYATNTTTPAIEVSAKSFYACQGGVWFVAGSATGPWTVTTSVPASIYTIPVTCPIHYVTYVYVYGSTPSVVYVGYTPGYLGVVVSPGGTVVYGTGYVYPPVVFGTTYVAYPPTYGYGASFALGTAVGFAFGYCVGHNSSCYYEPYWGCYHYAYPYHYAYAGYNVNGCNYYSHWGTGCAAGGWGYNPYTGRGYGYHSQAAFNPYTGAHGATYASGGFNAYSGNYAGVRTSSGYNPTTGRGYSGASSINGNVYTGNYHAGHTSDVTSSKTGSSISTSTSVTGNRYAGTADVSHAGEATSGRTGNSVSWGNGNVTADRNGNTYTSGDTAQNRATAQSQAQKGWSSRSSSAQDPWASRASASQSSWASRESAAQATGAQRFDNWSRPDGSGGWDDHSFGGGSGWGGSSGRWGGFNRDSGGWGGGDRGFGGLGGGGWGGGGRSIGGFGGFRR